MTASDRIRRVSYVVARELGGSPLAYMGTVAVILWLDESINRLDDWDDICDPEFFRAAREGLDELREKLLARAARHAELRQ